MTERRKFCACGCKQPVIGKRPEAIYASNACKVRAHKRRKTTATLAALDTAETPLPRFKPSARRTLGALRAAGGVGATTAELCQPHVGGVRFSARIYELRNAGLRIERVKLSNQQCRYWLRDSSAVASLFPVLRDPHAHVREELAA